MRLTFLFLLSLSSAVMANEFTDEFESKETEAREGFVNRAPASVNYKEVSAHMPSLPEIDKAAREMEEEKLTED